VNPEGILSPLDDHLVHQAPEPVRHVATSDRNFYDRHYFNVHARSADFFLIIGMGQYPNLGTQDAFVSLRENDEQITLRSSRRLGDRFDASCGPVRVEVLEGLQRLRLTIEPNESGISADLEFAATHRAQLEPRQTHRTNGRISQDIMRYCQNGNYSGWLKTPTRLYQSGDVSLQGYRDRSWGIRAVGGIETGAAPPQSGQQVNGLYGRTDWHWLHMACQFDQFTINVKLHENAHGERWLEDAVLLWNDGRPDRHLGRVQLQFTEFTLDRRWVKRARIMFSRSGEPDLSMDVTQVLPLLLEAGTGYGHRPINGWMHGQYRGESVTDVARYQLDQPSPALAGGVDCLATMEFEGQVGYGLFEYSIFGRIDGFEGPGFFNAVASKA
jgi:hypothetical protein